MSLHRIFCVAMLFAGLCVVAIADIPPRERPERVDITATPVREEAKAPKIGVVFSLYTATGPHWMPDPYGFTHTTIGTKLIAKGYDVVAVLDPGTQNTPEVKAELAERGYDSGWIDGADVEALSRLDVVVSGRMNPNMRPESVFALTEAVRRGTMFLNLNNFCTVDPGFQDASIEPLLGLKYGNYVWHPQPMSFKVMVKHPLLEEFEVGDIVHGIGFNGIGGECQGTVVLQAIPEPMGNFQGFGGETRPETVNALYYTELGKGIVLHSLLWGYNNLKGHNFPLDSEVFNRRCIDWLISERAKRLAE